MIIVCCIISVLCLYTEPILVSTYASNWGVQYSQTFPSIVLNTCGLQDKPSLGMVSGFRTSPSFNSSYSLSNSVDNILARGHGCCSWLHDMPLLPLYLRIHRVLSFVGPFYTYSSHIPLNSDLWCAPFDTGILLRDMLLKPLIFDFS